MIRFCPDCPDTMLGPVQIGPHTIDVCANCAGVWFDDGELNQISQGNAPVMADIDERMVPQVEHKEQPASIRNCPSCQSPMECYQYMYDSPVTLDSCPLCHGIWTEDGELTAMSKVLADKMQEPVDPAMHHHLGMAIEIANHHERIGKQQQLQRVMRIFSMQKRYPFGGWR